MWPSMLLYKDFLSSLECLIVKCSWKLRWKNLCKNLMKKNEAVRRNCKVVAVEKFIWSQIIRLLNIWSLLISSLLSYIPHPHSPIVDQLWSIDETQRGVKSQTPKQIEHRSLRLVYPVLQYCRERPSLLDLLSEFGLISDGWLGSISPSGDWANALECWRSPSLRLVIPGIAVSPGVTHSDSHHLWHGTVVKPEHPSIQIEHKQKVMSIHRHFKLGMLLVWQPATCNPVCSPVLSPAFKCAQVFSEPWWRTLLINAPLNRPFLHASMDWIASLNRSQLCNTQLYRL